MIKLIDLLNETNGGQELLMFALFADDNKDWSFNSSFKTKGLVAKYGEGANGKSFRKPSILCTYYGGGNPFNFGFGENWKVCVFFKKNTKEIYLDDEVYNYGKYPSREQEDEAVDYTVEMIKNKQDIPLNDLITKFGLEITKDDFPAGTYVLDIKPNEIIKITKGEGNIKF